MAYVYTPGGRFWFAGDFVVGLSTYGADTTWMVPGSWDGRDHPMDFKPGATPENAYHVRNAGAALNVRTLGAVRRAGR